MYGMVHNENIVSVSMSSMKTGQDGDVLVSCGIGSCVGIVLYDPVQKIGALAHVMLPLASGRTKPIENAYRFVETAIDGMVDVLLRMGALKNRLEAKVVGGASMFKMFDQDTLAIGNRNVDAVKNKLKKEHIRVVAAATGGNAGRSVKFYVSTGVVEVSTLI
jgi:chemotaxis protein CheD